MRHQGYDSEDSIDTWTLTPEDHALVAGKSRVNRLGFAVLLLFFRANGRALQSDNGRQPSFGANG